MAIKPITTHYRGYAFRSRLEARWAVFFTELGLKWEYEPEGFELPDGTRYLPDFRVTSPVGLQYWYEVKPLGGVDTKMAALRAYAKQAVDAGGASPFSWTDRFEVLVGDPVERMRGWYRCCPRCGFITEDKAEVSTTMYAISNGGHEVSVYCWACDYGTPSGGGHSEVDDGLLCKYTPHKGELILTSAEAWAAELRVRKTAAAARSARFEFNQSGPTR